MYWNFLTYAILISIYVTVKNVIIYQIVGCIFLNSIRKLECCTKGEAGKQLLGVIDVKVQAL